jgi:hypothetical protein
MKVAKRVSLGGQFAKIKEDIHAGDVVNILDGGQVVAGDYGDRHCFKIQTKNGERVLSFNQTTMNYLIDAFGDETTGWVGKDVKVWLVKSNIQGKMRDVVYLTALDWIEGPDGFYPPSVKTGEVDPNEIPF